MDFMSQNYLIVNNNWFKTITMDLLYKHLGAMKLDDKQVRWI